MKTLLLAALAGLLAGCSLFDSDDAIRFPGKEAVYEARYSQGIEDSWLEPCGIDELWMFDYEEDDPVLKDFFDRLSAQVEFANPAYVRLRGIPSQKGRFPGFFVTYDRKFRLRETLEVRPPRDGDCGG